MRALLVLLSLAAFAPAQENNTVVPSVEGFTIYQTVVSTYVLLDPAAFKAPPPPHPPQKREYSRHPDGREVLAQPFPALVKEPGHPLHGRMIWEPNGVTTKVVLPWKQFETVVEANNGRLSGNAKAGSSTCEPKGIPPIYVGNESLQGLDTYRWRYENSGARTDKWYWKQADCLEIQVEQLNKNADGSLKGSSYNIRFDRLVQHADLELFFIPSDFVEGSAVVAEKCYMERTRGMDFMKTAAEC